MFGRSGSGLTTGMSTNILKSVFSKVLTTGVIVAACVGGAALPASAATLDDSAPVSATGAVTYKAALDFQVQGYGVSLGEGTVDANDRIDMMFTKDAAGNPEIDAAWDYWATYAASTATYPILQGGAKTGFYIHPSIRTNNFTSAPIVQCEVYQGIPGAGGVVAPDGASPFSCDKHKHVTSNDWDFTVHPSGH